MTPTDRLKVMLDAAAAEQKRREAEARRLREANSKRVKVTSHGVVVK